MLMLIILRDILDLFQKYKPSKIRFLYYFSYKINSDFSHIFLGRTNEELCTFKNEFMKLQIVCI